MTVAQEKIISLIQLKKCFNFKFIKYTEAKTIKEQQMDMHIENKIVENNKEISRLLLENESLFKDAGYAPPSKNYVVEDFLRIKIPSGYIRTSNNFSNKYHLNSIVHDSNVKKNISYSLQLSDFYNFLLNRVYIWGSVQTMLYKNDIINIVSIIEALVLEATCNVRDHCANCQSINRCKNHISKEEKNKLKPAIKKLCSIGILNFSTDTANKIRALVDLRNRVHIRLANNNEFLDSKFNLEQHNNAILLLLEIAEELNSKVVPYYNKCVGFVEK